MNFGRSGMMLIIILLCLNTSGYCFFQGDGHDLEPAIQDMVSQRKVLKENYIAYKKKKELEKDKIRESLLQANNRLEYIKSNNGKNNYGIKNNENNKSPEVFNIQKKEMNNSTSRGILIILIASLIGVIIRIIAINKKK